MSKNVDRLDNTERAIEKLQTLPNQLYEAAAKELASSPRTGLLAKCMAKSDGDENKAKARYIEVRVGEMKKLDTEMQYLLQLLSDSTNKSPSKDEVSELDSWTEGFKEQLGGRPTCTQDDIARVKSFSNERAGLWVAMFDIKGNGRPTKYPTAKVAEAMAAKLSVEAKLKKLKGEA
jgi:hypothetical protein